jgi:hypothetical protein
MNKHELYHLVMDINIHKPAKELFRTIYGHQRIGSPRTKYLGYLLTHIGLIKINYN